MLGNKHGAYASRGLYYSTDLLPNKMNLLKDFSFLIKIKIRKIAENMYSLLSNYFLPIFRSVPFLSFCCFPGSDHPFFSIYWRILTRLFRIFPSSKPFSTVPTKMIFFLDYKSDHITVWFWILHWLPGTLRIKFKLLKILQVSSTSCSKLPPSLILLPLLQPPWTSFSHQMWHAFS